MVDTGTCTRLGWFRLFLPPLQGLHAIGCLLLPCSVGPLRCRILVRQPTEPTVGVTFAFESLSLALCIMLVCKLCIMLVCKLSLRSSRELWFWRLLGRGPTDRVQRRNCVCMLRLVGVYRRNHLRRLFEWEVGLVLDIQRVDFSHYRQHCYRWQCMASQTQWRKQQSANEAVPLRILIMEGPVSFGVEPHLP
jgi:hypothetical protein